MKIIQENDKQAILQRLNEMKDPVQIINFTQELECQYCKETRWLLEDLASLSDKISLTVFNFQIDKEKVKEYDIKRIPATVIRGDKDYGIRFYGIPSGYEFATFLDEIVAVSKKDFGLSPETKQKLREVTTPLHIQVFVTPTCPYCAAAVRISHACAMESDVIRADMIEVSEFPQLAVKYGIRGVPQTVVNEDNVIVGALPEKQFLARLLESTQKPPMTS